MTSTCAEGDAEPPTLLAALERTVALHGDALAVRTRAGDDRRTWREIDRGSRCVAAGLLGLGLGRGDAVALLVGNRPDFHVADLAVVLAGGVPVSVYPTSSPEQVAHVLQDSGARVLICEAAHRERLGATFGAITGLVVVWLDLVSPETGDRTWEELSASPPLRDPAPVGPDDLLTVIYTSGTTGPPKGVELTHRGVLAATAATRDTNGLRAGDRVISWLPMAHVAERKASHYAAVLCGLEVTSCPNARAILQVLPEVRPAWFFAVPRIWEKLRAAGQALPGEPSPADVRRALGLDGLRAANVGAAPCSPDVVRWVRGLGVPLTEVYGMTENAACCTSTRPDDQRVGVVGHAMPGVELRLAEDGEILMRSPTVMRGYRGRPEATAEVLTDDGWLRTGDVGTLSDDGCLAVVDRKKDLIIGAAGKNMSPSAIEDAIRGASGLIGQVCVVGDGRSYNVALVALDPDATGGLDRAAVEAEVARGVAAGNARLSRVEQVKRHLVVDRSWTPGSPELTPTMKVRRRAIAEAYRAEIEALYSG